MKRFIFDELIKWKNNPKKKPLILNGARQVGKTWLMLELGKNHYKDYVYLNFEHDEKLAEVFKNDLNVHRIITNLGYMLNKNITPDTLIIFDEIQEVPRVLTSLKYFCEDKPEYSVICAGSLLGVSLHKGVSFPVGKVEHLDIYPLSYKEFLLGTDRENLVEVLNNKDWELIKILENDYINALKEYFIVGGMPGVINCFLDTQNFEAVAKAQNEIIYNYNRDFSKHTDNNVSNKIRMIWDSLSGQLSKENKKFIYGYLKEGAKAKEYEEAINWLKEGGLVHKINRVTTPGVPINFYKDIKTFKLYLLDVGLLCRLCDINPGDMFLGEDLFVEFKGALTEQFVCEELITQGHNIAYYTDNSSRNEIDFITKIGKGIVPIEVKANRNLRARSLQNYMTKYNPEYAIRTSLANYKVDNNLYDIPLYAISEIRNILKK